MLKFFKSFFSGKATEPTVEAPYKVEAPETKVEAVNAQPVAKAPVAKANKAKAPAKKRTLVKRDEGDSKAKVAKIKAPAKPKAKKEAK